MNVQELIKTPTENWIKELTLEYLNTGDNLSVIIQHLLDNKNDYKYVILILRNFINKIDINNLDFINILWSFISDTPKDFDKIFKAILEFKNINLDYKTNNGLGIIKFIFQYINKDKLLPYLLKIMKHENFKDLTIEDLLFILTLNEKQLNIIIQQKQFTLIKIMKKLTQHKDINTIIKNRKYDSVKLKYLFSKIPISINNLSFVVDFLKVTNITKYVTSTNLDQYFYYKYENDELIDKKEIIEIYSKTKNIFFQEYFKSEYFYNYNGTIFILLLSNYKDNTKERDLILSTIKNNISLFPYIFYKYFIDFINENNDNTIDIFKDNKNSELLKKLVDFNSRTSLWNNVNKAKFLATLTINNIIKPTIFTINNILNSETSMDIKNKMFDLYLKGDFEISDDDKKNISVYIGAGLSYVNDLLLLKEDEDKILNLLKILFDKKYFKENKIMVESIMYDYLIGNKVMQLTYVDIYKFFSDIKIQIGFKRLMVNNILNDVKNLNTKKSINKLITIFNMGSDIGMNFNYNFFYYLNNKNYKIIISSMIENFNKDNQLVYLFNDLFNEVKTLSKPNKDKFKYVIDRFIDMQKHNLVLKTDEDFMDIKLYLPKYENKEILLQLKQAEINLKNRTELEKKEAKELHQKLLKKNKVYRNSFYDFNLNDMLIKKRSITKEEAKKQLQRNPKNILFIYLDDWFKRNNKQNKIGLTDIRRIDKVVHFSSLGKMNGYFNNTEINNLWYNSNGLINKKEFNKRYQVSDREESLSSNFAYGEDSGLDIKINKKTFRKKGRTTKKEGDYKIKTYLKPLILDYMEEHKINKLTFFNLLDISKEFNDDTSKNVVKPVREEYFNKVLKELINVKNINTSVIEWDNNNEQRLDDDLTEEVFQVYLNNDNQIRKAFFKYAPFELSKTYMQYLKYDDHPIKKDKLNLGWVRFQRYRGEIFIEEIQTDLTKILLFEHGFFGNAPAEEKFYSLLDVKTNKDKAELKKQSNYLNKKLAETILTMFITYRDKVLKPRHKIIIPDGNLRKSLLGGSGNPSNYDNNAKQHKFSKSTLGDTMFDDGDNEDGIVYIKEMLISMFKRMLNKG